VNNLERSKHLHELAGRLVEMETAFRAQSDRKNPPGARELIHEFKEATEDYLRHVGVN